MNYNGIDIIHEMQAVVDSLYNACKISADDRIHDVLHQEEFSELPSTELVRLNLLVHNPETQAVLSQLAGKVPDVLASYVDVGLDPGGLYEPKGDEAKKAFKAYAQEKGSRLNEQTDREDNSHLDDIEFCAECVDLVRLGGEFYAAGKHMEAELKSQQDSQIIALQQAGLLQCDLKER